MTQEEKTKLKCCGIYKITCKINGKVYIGASKNVLNRWQHHLSFLRSKDINKKGNPYLIEDFQKYGEDEFTIEVIEECNENLLYEREDYWLNFYGGEESSLTYNCYSAGSKGKKPNIETRKKISQANMGKTVSEETKRILSQQRIGKRMCEHARQMLIERNHRTREQLREKNLGRIFITDGVNDKMIKPELLEYYQKLNFRVGRTKTRWVQNIR